MSQRSSASPGAPASRHPRWTTSSAAISSSSSGDPGPSSLYSILSPSAGAPKRKRSTSRGSGGVSERGSTFRHGRQAEWDDEYDFRGSITPTPGAMHVNPIPIPSTSWPPAPGMEQSWDPGSAGSSTTSSAGGGGWTYHLEIVQQPQRARACGFGDKDRRPLSPPPIIRLWVRTSSGELVDPNHVSIQFLVLMCDLWSADGHQHRDVVMHPSSQGQGQGQGQSQGQGDRAGAVPGAASTPVRATSPTLAPSHDYSRPNTANSRPGSSGLGWAESAHRAHTGWSYPSVLSPAPSPRSVSNRQVPPPLPVPSVTGWPPPSPTRPSTTRGRSFTRPNVSFAEAPRPVTAPSHSLSLAQMQSSPKLAHNTSSSERPNFILPPLSSITRHGSDAPIRLTLPALQEHRTPTRDTHTSSSATSSSFIPTDHSFGRPGSSSSSAWYPPSMVSEARHSLSSVGSGSEVMTPYREAGPPFERLHISDASRQWDTRPRTADRDRPRTADRHITADRPLTAGYPGSGPGLEHDRAKAERRRESQRSYDQLLQYSFGAGDNRVLPRLEMPRSVPAHIGSTPTSSTTAMPATTGSLTHNANANPNANYSRVLVGSLCATCQRLQDDKGQVGLFFFAHDLGVRTEGTFRLRFSLTDLTSIMRETVIPGEKVQVLAETHSDPFTVYSAKRFPGVIPTTAMTRLFARQNVRLPTRQRRATGAGAADVDSDGDGDED